MQCALLTYLAERDRLAFARANDPAAVSNRHERKSAVLFAYSDGQIPVVANLLAGHNRVADDIGGSAAQMPLRFLATAPSPTLGVAIGAVQKIIQMDLDLHGQLPLPEHNESASGPCIAAGLLITPILTPASRMFPFTTARSVATAGSTSCCSATHVGLGKPAWNGRNASWPKRPPYLAETAPFAVG